MLIRNHGQPKILVFIKPRILTLIGKKAVILKSRLIALAAPGFAARTFLLAPMALGLIINNTVIAAPRETGFPLYHEVKRFKIGGEQHWNHLTVDAKARWLYIAEDQKVVVINIDTGKLVGEVSESPGAQQVVIIPGSKTGYVTSSQDNAVTVFNSKNLKVTQHIKVGEKPGPLVYDETSKKLFAFNQNSKNVSVIEVKTNKVVETLELGGKPEAATSDHKGHIYVNLEDQNQMAVIATRELKVTEKNDLKPCEKPRGVAFDARLHRLFVGCRNNIVVSFDSLSHKVINNLEVGRGVDDVIFDSERRLIFVSAGEGRLYVFRESKRGFENFQNIETQAGSKTLALDTYTGRLFLGAADFTENSATVTAPLVTTSATTSTTPTPTAPAAHLHHHNVVPGSFSVIVIDR